MTPPLKSLDLRIEDAIDADIEYQEHERKAEAEQIELIEGEI